MDRSASSESRTARDQAQSGSVAVSLLIVLAFLAILIAAAVAYLDRWYGSAGNELQTDRIHVRLDNALGALIKVLAADPTPSSNSLVDPVWSWIPSQHLAHITLEDVSSRIDPNWTGTAIFDLPSIHELFKPSSVVSGNPASFLQQYRFEHGFFTGIAKGYGMLFSPKTAKRYLSPWAYANVNLSGQFALQKLYEVRTGDITGSRVLLTKIQNLRKGHRLVDEKELASFLGPYYRHLYPVVNALPWWNVQFLPELILRAVLSYPPYKIKHPTKKADEILRMRSSGSITPAELRAIVGLPKGKEVYQYLGTVTWFWKATIRIKNVTLTAVVCRLPPKLSGGDAGAVDKPHFRVVWRHYAP